MDNEFYISHQISTPRALSYLFAPLASHVFCSIYKWAHVASITDACYNGQSITGGFLQKSRIWIFLLIVHKNYQNDAASSSFF